MFYQEYIDDIFKCRAEAFKDRKQDVDYWNAVIKDCNLVILNIYMKYHQRKPQQERECVL